MKLSAFSGIIKLTFTDNLDVYRYTEIDNDDDTTDVVLSETPIHTQVPCRVSYIKMESPLENSIDGVPILTAIKLFFAITEDVIEGDFIVVRKVGTDGTILATFSGTLGLPSVYETHKEALISIKEMA